MNNKRFNMIKRVVFSIILGNLMVFGASAAGKPVIKLVDVHGGLQRACLKNSPLNFSACGECLQVVATEGAGRVVLVVSVNSGTAGLIAASLPQGWELPNSRLSVTYNGCTNVPTGGTCTITFQQGGGLCPIAICREGCQTVSITVDGTVGFTVEMQIGTII